ncbi:Uncharacterized protein dnl_23110 [Desulfonema limicola]|uniref:Tandem-95 repeat protein n=1 Tax=Desulfonema limicola TaxID=45656 RepID=A0A975GG78_9BACT|nr:hypothetical protein [Desulfonema limicola]QTA80025.1 Uncharacterized protein dnl_23110 [Desulfonema limicola]
MKIKTPIHIILAFLSMLFLCITGSPVSASTGNIDAADKYAWSENAGWTNFRPIDGGVTVYSDHLEGYAWSECLGWIKLGSSTGGGTLTYANTSNTDWGVNHDGAGNLSGYAWSENGGWLNFNPADSQVIFDTVTGSFDGYAWSETLGWIHFKNAAPAYNVVFVNNIPTLTAFSAVIDTTNEDTEVEITFADLTAQGNEADADGTITGFVIKAVSTGTLKIGADAATATAYVLGTNDTVDASNNAYWTPAANAGGTLNAFELVAVDNSGAESATTGIIAQVSVTAVNDIPTFTAFTSFVDTTNEDTEVEITFADLTAQGNEADIEGTIDAFIVKAVSTGTLRIGTDAATAAAYAAGINDTIDASNNAYWTPALNAGSTLNAFELVAVDNSGAESATTGVIAQVSVTAVNDIPTFTAFTTFVDTTDEDTEIEITFADLTAQGNETDSDGTITGFVIKAVSTGTLKIGADAATAAAYVLGTNDIVDASNNAYWTPAANAGGTLNAFELVAVDNTGAESVTTGIIAQVSVTAVNDIPTFTAFTSFVDTTNEDTEVEITLADLTAQGNEADADGTVTAFVIKAVSTGTLKIGADAATATAYVLGTNDTVDASNNAYWTPAANAGGTLNAFELVAVDNSGAESATTGVIAQVSVTAVNDIPTFTTFTTFVDTTNEDTEVEITFADLTAQGNEADADGTVTAFVIKSVSTGTLKIGADAATATAYVLGTNDTVDASNNAYWTPAANAGGTLNAFELVAVDNSGAESATTGVIAQVSVTAVNDIPTFTTFTTFVDTTNEDTEIEITLADLTAQGNEADSDGTITGFVIKAVSTGTLKIGPDAATATAYILGTNDIVDASNNAYWTPAANASGTLNAFELVAVDNSGAESATTGVIAQVSVTAVNDIPTFTAFTTFVDTTDEDTEIEITFADLTAQGNEADSDGTIAGFVIKAVSTGTLKIGADAATAAAYVLGTNDTVDASNNAYWTPAANAGGTLNAFELVAVDNSGAESATTGVIAQVSVTAVNDIPTFTTFTTFVDTTNEDTEVEITFADLTAQGNEADADGTVTAFVIKSVSTGTLKIGADAATAEAYVLGSNDTVDASNNAYWTPAANASGTINAFELVAVDNTGAESATTGVIAQVSVTAVNDIPTFTAFTSFVDTTNEDTEVEITLADLTAQGNEADADGTVTAFVIKSVSTGTLKIGADAATAKAYVLGSNDTVDASNNAYWTPAANAGGTINAFELVAVDNTGAESATTGVIAQVSVTAVNDIPTFTAFTSFVDTTNEDTEVEITLADLTAQGNEADSDGTITGFVIKAVSTGTLKIGADAATAAAYILGTNDTVDASNNAYWTPAANANGTINAFELVAVDNTGAESATTGVIAQVSVTAVNDIPTFTAFTTFVDTTGEDTEVEITFADLTAQGNEADADGTITGFVIKAVSTGTLKIGPDAATAAAYVLGTNDIVDASNNAYWTPALNANGTINAFELVAVDNSGAESATTGVIAQVSVTAVNDIPTFTAFTSFVDTTSEDTEVEITLADLTAQGNEADADGTITGFVIKAVSTGTLKIGADAATAAVYVLGSNDTVDASNNAYWTPAANAGGTINAFELVAVDNTGAESATTGVIAQVSVTAVNDIPTLTAFADIINITNKDTEVEISFADLEAQGDEADSDGTVTAFVIKSVLNGTLRIGADAATAAAYALGTNDIVDASNNAYWTPDVSATGTLNAFEVTAIDNIGAESATAGVIAQVLVTEVNEIPTLTAFADLVDTTDEDTEVEITFADLAAQGDEADIDGTVTAFVIKSVSTGTLRIGPDAAAATAYVPGTNDIVDASNNAYWTPDVSATGTLEAFEVIAMDNIGAGSATAGVIAQVSVTEINEIPTLTFFADLVGGTNKDTEVEITFADLETQGDEADADGTVTGFVIKAVSTGTLRIGADAATAAAYVLGTNDTVDASNNAYWTPDVSVSGTINAFELVAKDDSGAESATTGIIAQILVTAVNEIPILTAFAAVVDGTIKDTEVEITFADLEAQGDEADIDGTVTAFVIKSILNGTLRIGANAAAATAYVPGTNDIVDASNNAYWTPDVSATGTLNAFEVTAIDNIGAESATAGVIAQVLVTEVNEIPTLTAFADLVDTTDEDTEIEISFADLAAQGDEADIDGTVTAFVIKSVSTGTLRIGADAAAATAYVSGTNDIVDASNNAYWTPAANANGTLNAFGLVVKDNNGDESSTAVIAQVSVTAVNDIPTMTAFAAAVDGTSKDTEVEISFADLQGQGDEADVDGTVTAFIIKSVSTGTLKIGASAATAKAYAPGTNETVNASDNAYWTPAANAAGTLEAFEVIAMDNSGAKSVTTGVIAQVLVIEVNEIPTLTAFAGVVDTADEDTEVEITFAELAAQGNEADADGSITAFMIKSVSTGTLKIGADAATATAYALGTNDIIDVSNNAYWTPPSNAAGTINAFEAAVKDNTGTESVTAVIAQVSVTGANDIPTLTAFANVVDTTEEDTEVEITFAELAAQGNESDPDGDITAFVIKAVMSGTLKIGTDAAAAAPYEAGVNDTVNALNNAYWIPETDAGGIMDCFEITAKDSSGAESLTTGIIAQVSVTAVNDIPSLTAFAAAVDTTNEDTEVEITLADLTAQGNEADVDGSVTGFVIKSVLTGTLKIGADAATAAAYAPGTNDTIDASNNAYWTPAANANGTLNAFEAAARDNSGAESAAGVIAQVSVTSVNDIPTLTGFASFVDTTNEDTQVEITFADLAAQGDEADSDGTVTGFVIKAVSSGTLKIGADAATAAAYAAGTNDTIDALNNAFWMPPADESGLMEVFEVTAKDNSGAESLTAVVMASISVAMVNDFPTLTAFADIVDSTNEDTEIEITFADLKIQGDEADSDGTVTGFAIKKVLTGTLKIGPDSATATAYAAGTNDMVDSLNNAYWTPAPNSNDTISAFEAAATDDMGAESVNTAAAQVYVGGLNDIPTLTAFETFVDTADEDTEIEITFADLTAQGNEADADGIVTAFIIKSVSAGTLKIGPDSAAATSYEAGINDMVDPDSNAYWTPPANENGILNVFEVTAKDDTGAESVTPGPFAQVSVTPVNDIPTLTAFTGFVEKTEDTSVEITFAAIAEKGNENDIDGSVTGFVVKNVISGSLEIGPDAASATAYEAGINDIIDSGNNAYWTLPAQAAGNIDVMEVRARDDLGAESSKSGVIAQVSIPVKIISGTVTLNESGLGSIEIMAVNKADPSDTRLLTTDEQGRFELKVSAGEEWYIEPVIQEGTDWLSPPKQIIGFSDTSSPETRDISLNLLPAAGQASGQILDSSGSPLANYDNVSICVYDALSMYNECFVPDSSGNFILTLPQGKFETFLSVDDPDYSGPELTPIDIVDGNISIGEILLNKKDAAVQVFVRDNQGQGIAGIKVRVWQPGNNVSFDAETDNTGVCLVNVTAGVWSVMPIIAEDTDYIYSGSSKEAAAVSNEVKTIDFILDAVSYISGRVEDEEGNILENVEAWAFTQLLDDSRKLTSAKVEKGSFTLKIPSEEYIIGLLIEPGSPYSVVNDEIQIPEPGTPVTIRFKKNDYSITGRIIDEDGMPVTGLSGQVMVSPQGNDHTNTIKTSMIDTSNGSFSIQVPNGTWNLTYELDDNEEYALYPDSPLQIYTDKAEVTQDIVIKKTDGIVEGIVYDVDGNPAANVDVWISYTIVNENEKQFSRQNTVTDINGYYRFYVPSETEVYVGTSLANEEEYVQNARSLMETYKKNAPIQLTRARPRNWTGGENLALKLRQTDTVLSGIVTNKDGTPAANASVSVQGIDGQTSKARTDTSGKYNVSIIRANSSDSNKKDIKVSIKRKRKPVGSTLVLSSYSRSDDIYLSTHGAESDITTDNISMGSEIPLPQSEAEEFNISEGLIKVLSDGSRIIISGNSFSIDEDKAGFTISPVVEGLPDSTVSRVIGYAYDIGINGIQSKRSVPVPFDKQMVVTLAYTDAELTHLNAREGDIRPALFSKTTDSWEPILNYTIDTENRKVSFSTNRMGVFGLVAIQTLEIVIPGDLDKNGTVDLSDAVIALKICTGIDPETEFFMAGDVNRDSKIGMEEVVYIIQDVAGIR